MSQKSRGAPSPFVMRCAHHSTRGKPAQPATLDASPAPAAPTASLCSDRPGFPRLPVLGARASPPTATPAALELPDTRRRSATCRRLTCGSPRPRLPGWGRGALGATDSMSSPTNSAWQPNAAPLRCSASLSSCAPIGLPFASAQTGSPDCARRRGGMPRPSVSTLKAPSPTSQPRHPSLRP